MAFVNQSIRGVARTIRCPVFSYKLAASPATFYHQRRLLSSNSVDDTFKMAITKVSGLQSEPGNEVKLQLYALYKQSTVGPCKGEKPGMFDVVAKYKWEAWTKLGNKSKEEAMKEYIALVENLIKSIDETEGSKATSTPTAESEGLLISNKQGVLTLKLNRPEKKNALLVSMYHDITKTLNDAAKDDNVKMVVLTGTGDFFSSGNDLIKGLGASIVHSLRPPNSDSASNFQFKADTDVAKLVNDSTVLLENFVNSFIEFPKPLMAVVNGHAFGIMVTILALFDNVICSDKATFTTPFLSTSQTPEGCSSYTFPRIMGTAKANAMLLFNQPLTAQEAFQCGFVSKVIPHDQLESYVDSFLYGDKGLFSFGSTITWRNGKPMIRTPEEIEILKKVNRMECQKLGETWLSPDFTQAMMKFLTRKK